MAFSVDTEQIGTAASDIARIAGDIETSVAAMMARLTGLQSTWSGAAATEFQGAVTDWRATQTRVRENLATIGTLTARAGTSYAHVEDGVRLLFRR
ncbi:MAG: WXG100 family type VII secretion target [Dermatophilaceae bacterium]